MSFKIIFMGTPEFAVPTLKSLYESKHEILCVYTKPPTKRSRGQKIISSPIDQFATKLKIPVRHPNNLDNIDELNFIKKLKPQYIIVVAYGQIIPKNLLDVSGITFLNIHASILPKWRGAAPIQRAIMNRDKETGISIMKIINELDAGPVMKTVKIDITNECTYEKLSKKMSDISANTMIEALDILEKKNERFISQNDSKATYAKKIEKFEAKLNWKEKAENLVAKINALHPNPGSWFEIDGSRIKVLKAKEIKKKGKPGEIIDDNFTIACFENSIQILELRKEGKKSMSASDFLKGNKLKIGNIINGI